MAVKFGNTPVALRPLKWAFVGKSDAGKTFTMLKIAKLIGGKWALLDTDGKRSEDYAETFDLNKWCKRAFFGIQDKLNPKKWMEALDAVEETEPAYDGLIIDTGTPFWLGILDLHAARAEEMANKKPGRTADQFTAQAWSGPHGGNKPFYSVMTRLAEFPIHVFCSFRAKPEWDTSGGGLRPTGEFTAHFRPGDHMYEFTLVSWLARSGNGKTRNMTFEKTSTCHQLEGETFPNPGKEVLDVVRKWRKF